MKSLNLKALKSALSEHHFAQAAKEIESIFNSLKQYEFFSAQPDPKQNDPTARIFCTQLSECISILFTSYAYRLNEAQFIGWLCFAREIQSVFAISEFQSTDHLLEQWVSLLNSILNSPANDERTLQDLQQLIMRLLLFYSFDNQAYVNLESIYQQFPTLAVPTLFNLLSTQIVHTAEGHNRREHALGFGKMIENYQISNPLVVINLSIAWMMVSYGTRPDRNEIKKTINLCLTSWLTQNSAFTSLQNSQRKNSSTKPTLLMVWEYFSPVHAMTRAFAPLIKQLSEKFNLIALLINEADDLGEYQKYYTKVINFNLSMAMILKNPAILRKRIISIQQLNLDMIYFPSIGMQEIGVILANLRIAPIQVMGFGHPASSYSANIDYGMIEENLAPNTYTSHSEKLIILPNLTQPVLPLAQVQHIRRESVRDTNVIHIAVSAMIAKISAKFLATCQEIVKKSKRPIKLVFFIYQSELFHLQSKKFILTTIPNAEVHSRLSPEKYLTLLNQCHLYLSTFPFCGANSIIDAICLGLPIISLAGNDPSSLTGSAIMRNCELPEKLITQSPEEYIAMALQLVHNDEERCQISNILLAKSHAFLNPENPQFFSKTDNLAKALLQIYQKHELINQNAKNRYYLDELYQLTV